MKDVVWAARDGRRIEARLARDVARLLHAYRTAGRDEEKRDALGLLAMILDERTVIVRRGVGVYVYSQGRHVRLEPGMRALYVRPVTNELVLRLPMRAPSLPVQEAA